MNAAWEELRQHLREAATLSATSQLLAWDQETMMPPQAGAFRAEQLSLLARLTHERATHPRVGELIETCENDARLKADPRLRAGLRELRRDYDRARRLPAALVAEIGATASRALEAWRGARQNNDFAAFLPWLDRQLDLHRQKAACYGVPEGGESYDALLEDYEPGMTARQLISIFDELRVELVPLIRQIAESGREPDLGPLSLALSVSEQRALNERILRRLGFDLEAGRLDSSTHPFSSGIAPGDTRVTTRFREDSVLDALSSTLHEAGHGMYEQGLPKAEYLGLPPAEPVSLGIHESQSRLWENHVGRSRAFWTWAVPELQNAVGPTARTLTVDGVWRAINVVRPGLIRVESDEATYHLHVMLRFELERALLHGELAARDLPGAWNAIIERDLGLRVPDDAHGCLQDIHWASGAIGYFPTYTLGSLYAAQFFDAARAELTDLDAAMARGDFSELLGWLRRTIHARGRELPAHELCKQVTGRPLSHASLLDHLRTKLTAVYGIELSARHM